MGADDQPQLITSDAVLPMDEGGSAVIGEAGIVVQGGRILGVGSVGELRTKFGELRGQHFPGVMVPGFVNAHVHLELTYQRGKIEPMAFPRWVETLMKNYPAEEQLQEVISGAVREGIAESLRFGVTSVGDISRRCGISRAVLESSPINAVSYGEVVGLGRMREVVDGLLPVAAARMESGRPVVGVSPHAPFTVEGPTLRKILSWAKREKLPVAMHLAEHAEEAAFLRDLSGPLGREWDLMMKIDILDETIPLMEGGPIRWAKRWGLLDAGAEIPVVLAHVNYCDGEEMGILAAARGVSVVYCPRTRAYFGHDEVKGHPYREMLEAGINVALGTDSLASNPDLSVLREGAFLWKRDGADPMMLLEMITRRGAVALGMGNDTGTLSMGKRADFLVLPIENISKSAREICVQVLEQAPLPSEVWASGRRI